VGHKGPPASLSPPTLSLTVTIGLQVLKWYKERALSVTPVHPRETELQGLSAVKTLDALPDLSSTAVSVITAPPVRHPFPRPFVPMLISAQITMTLLPSMLEPTGPPYVWLQPGTFDDSVTAFIAEKGLEGRVVYGNHACVLVEGDDIRARL
jgi:predicted CoA-binding protein